MRFIKTLYYSFFTLFVVLFGLTYFAEQFFSPSAEQIKKDISRRSRQELKSGSYDFNGTSMGYVSIGNDTAQRVILVHGSPGSFSNYYKVLEHAEFYQKFNLIAMDRYGYGMSGGKHGLADLALQAASIRELCKPTPGGRKPILVGHSMGGPIVIKSAIDYGNELAGVISVAGSFDADLEFDEFYRGFYKVFPINLFFNRDLKASNDELITHFVELRKMSTEWEKITCYVNIIQGGKDPLVAPGNIEYAKQKLKNNPKAVFTFIPEEDHFIPFGDHPESLFKAIEEMAAY